MKLKKILFTLILIFSTLYACHKEKEDNTLRNLLLLGVARSQSSSSSSSCTSGMIVCIPKGIAE